MKIIKQSERANTKRASSYELPGRAMGRSHVDEKWRGEDYFYNHTVLIYTTP